MRSKPLLELISNSSKHIPFTLKQAEAICKNYQYLNGKVFDTSYIDVSAVCAIVITPFEEGKKVTFINEMLSKGFKNVNIDEYSLQLYDVAILAYIIPEKDACICMDIATYMHKHNIDFNPDHFLL